MWQRPSLNIIDQCMFYTMVDTAIQQLKERFSSSSRLNKYNALEDVLLTGVVNEKCQRLAASASTFPAKAANQSCEAGNEHPPRYASRSPWEFSEVEALVRLLLVSPSSSAEAKRSFRALRRLKTWQRSTVTQTRLNAVAICHVHQNLDSVDVKQLTGIFVSRNEIRLSMFGNE